MVLLSSVSLWPPGNRNANMCNKRLKSIDLWEQISKNVQIRVSTYTRAIQISLVDDGRGVYCEHSS